MSLPLQLGIMWSRSCCCCCCSYPYGYVGMAWCVSNCLVSWEAFGPWHGTIEIFGDRVLPTAKISDRPVCCRGGRVPLVLRRNLCVYPGEGSSHVSVCYQTLVWVWTSPSSFGWIVTRHWVSVGGGMAIKEGTCVLDDIVRVLPSARRDPSSQVLLGT